MNPERDRNVEQPSDAKGEPARLAVRDLLQGRSEVILVHNDEDYRLRITSRGKLILTK
ncbi:MAG: hemin uptake protein HemP [Phycisphaerae bacterium]